jgi:hypothetical protein
MLCLWPPLETCLSVLPQAVTWQYLAGVGWPMRGIWISLRWHTKVEKGERGRNEGDDTTLHSGLFWPPVLCVVWPFLLRFKQMGGGVCLAPWVVVAAYGYPGFCYSQVSKCYCMMFRCPRPIMERRRCKQCWTVVTSKSRCLGFVWLWPDFVTGTTPLNM